MITAFRMSKWMGILCVLQLLSKSIEQLRQPSAHLQESEEELEDQQQQQHKDDIERMQEDALPPGGVIRKHTLSSSSGSSSEMPDAPCGVIKVKEEPVDSEDEALTNQRLQSEQSTYLHQVKGRLVIRAMIWEGMNTRSSTFSVHKHAQLHTCSQSTAFCGNILALFTPL